MVTLGGALTLGLGLGLLAGIFLFGCQIDGGYCFEFTAGSPDFSAFTTF